MSAGNPVQRQQSGQVITIAVLFMSVLLGMMSMAIDLGLFFEDRRHLQNTADAAALAGVAELPGNPDLARDAGPAVGEQARHNGC